jgi:hypothetical protein
MEIDETGAYHFRFLQQVCGVFYIAQYVPGNGAGRLLLLGSEYHRCIRSVITVQGVVGGCYQVQFTVYYSLQFV